MKKIILIIISISLLSIISLYLISFNKVVKLDFFTLYETRGIVMDSDRRFSITFYSHNEKSIVLSPISNEYTLELDDMKIRLEDVKITNIKINNDTYLIKLTSSMPKIGDHEYISFRNHLVITNSNYKVILELGAISFLNPNAYKLISLDSLYGSFMYSNKELSMVGVNFTLHDEYEYLTTLRLGPITYGVLSKSKKTQLENIIDMNTIGYNYNMSKVEKEYLMNIDSKDYFIPLGYINKAILRESYIIFKIDLETYYFDTFSFMTNELDPSEYPSYIKEGEIIYA